MDVIHTKWVEEEFVTLGNEEGAAGRADEGALRAALAKWRSYGGIPSPGFADFKPIEGKPFMRKMWEAVKQGSKRDGIHGYRLFYRQFFNPTKASEAAVIVMCWGKSGKVTPRSVLMTAWERCELVEAEIRAGRFF